MAKKPGGIVKSHFTYPGGSKLLVHLPGFMERVDDWRAQQRPVPNRSAAIRIMCEDRMATDAKVKRK